MKNLSTFLFIIFFFSTSFISAQSWAPFYAGDTVNFQTKGSSYITHSLWIDSISQSPNENISYLNRIGVPCDTCSNTWGPILGNQPQFLMREMHTLSDGVYSFRDTNAFTLLSQSILNETWLWDTIQGISAEVISINQGMVLGQLDSLKTIVLSSNDTLILSKGHGLLTFFDGYGNNSKVNNVGIENRNLGERIPQFSDYFTFEVGDEFFHKRIESSLQESFTYYIKSIITEKYQYGDTLIYQIKQFGSYQYVNDPLVYIDTFWDDWVYINHPTHPTNAYPNQLIPATSGCASDYENLHYLIHYDGETKSWDEIYVRDTTSQDLYHYDVQVGFLDPYELFKEGIGSSASNCYIFEAGTERIFLGKIGGTDTTGTIPADSLLFTALEQSIPEGLVKMYPNPISENIVIEVGETSYLPAIFRLRDINGKIICEKMISSLEKKISIPYLSKGLYIGEFITKDGGVLREKLVKD